MTRAMFRFSRGKRGGVYLMGRGLVRTVLAGGSFVLDCRLVDDCGGACCSVCVVFIVYIYLFCVFGSRWYSRALCPSLPRLTVGKRPVVVVAVQGAPISFVYSTTVLSYCTAVT